MDTLHFERRELKYVVPENRIPALRRFIAPYTRLDHNGAGLPGNRYTIHNVYLETPRMDFYRACLDESPDRIKLRIRWYDEEANGPLFLEVKHKVREVVVKDRARATRDEALAVLDGKVPAAAATLDRGDWRLFIDRATTMTATPLLYVRYTREAYESIFGEYARVTFDRAICFQEAGHEHLREKPNEWTYVDGASATKGIPRAAIMELKTERGTAPRWMADLVSHFGLRRSGFSKYANSVRCCLESTDRLRGSARSMVLAG